jgi:DNA-binding NarL/FixJ family response regulator
MNPIIYPAMTKRVASWKRREDVLRCMWDGRGTKEIAAELGISPKTVEYHRAKLYQLFGVQDPVSLCRRAVVAGFLQSEVRSPKSEGNVENRGAKRGARLQ